MKTTLYEIEDNDVIECFFGEHPEFKALTEVARENARMIWEGEAAWLPGVDQSDTITLGDCDSLHEHGGVPGEYVVLGRTITLPANELVVIVARCRFEHEEGMSS